VNNLIEIGDEAAASGVILALETHDHWTDSSVFARLMAQVDHPHIRVLWDLHHPYRTNGEPPEVTYANLAPYIASTHVKDSVPGGPHSYPQTDWEHGHTYVPIGQGDVPLRKMLRMLVGGGYDGYAIFEWEKRWYPDVAEPEEVFPHYVQQMRAWLQEIEG
jgi:sugar phosphate isomerase/epimerase